MPRKVIFQADGSFDSDLIDQIEALPGVQDMERLPGKLLFRVNHKPTGPREQIRVEVERLLSTDDAPLVLDCAGIEDDDQPTDDGGNPAA